MLQTVCSTHFTAEARSEQSSPFSASTLLAPRLCGEWAFPICSLNFLNVRQNPAFLEHGLFRAIETESREPLPAGRGINPVVFLASRRGRSEKHIDRSVRVLLHFLTVGIELD